jgi:hypothetical protein
MRDLLTEVVMKKRLVTWILISLILSVGCMFRSPSKTMQSWIGSHQSQLILSWGPPTRSTSDGADGTILIYEYDRNLGQRPGRAVRNYDGSISYTAPVANGYVATRMFWVNSKGFIYNWRWKGF